MAELALDDDQRHALARHLHGVDVAELVEREAPAHTGSDRGAAQLRTGGRGRPMSAPGLTVDDAKQRTDREVE